MSVECWGLALLMGLVFSQVERLDRLNCGGMIQSEKYIVVFNAGALESLLCVTNHVNASRDGWAEANNKLR